jgi:hypothetical protein
MSSFGFESGCTAAIVLHCRKGLEGFQSGLNRFACHIAHIFAGQGKIGAIMGV